MLKKLSVLLFCFITMVFASAQTFNVGGIIYNIISGTQNVEVIGGYSGDLTIPSNVDNGGINYTVTSIGDSAFSGSSLTSVTIPNTVTSIGDSAFYNCFTLSSCTIPNSVTIIKDYAFYHCGLRSVTFPSSLTSIGAYAFFYTYLSSVTIPNSVTSIGESAFSTCPLLSSVTLPDSITTIENFVFSYCTSLTSISIPNSVTSIGSNAFYYCSGLTSIVCDIATPLVIDHTVFAVLDQSSCSLTVPAGSVAAYQAADVWQDFNPIIGDSSLNTSEINTKNNVVLYPNPVHNEAILEIKNSENANLEVYDMNGKMVLRKSLNNNSKNTISTSNFPKGVYLFKVGKSVTKVIKN